MPDSDIIQFGYSIRMVDWSSCLTHDISSTALVDIFETVTSDLLNIHFPLKKITITTFDKPWINEELKSLRRKRSRAYCNKGGTSQEYLDLKSAFSENLKCEAKKYTELGSAYSAVRRLGAGVYDAPKASFEIASFDDQGYSNQESADLLADHFSKISQEFDPIDVGRFPPNVRGHLRKGRLEQT